MRRAHRTTKRLLNKRADLPCVGFEMDWVFFNGGYRGGWRWGNPKTLWGVKSRQEKRADISAEEATAIGD